MGLSIYKLGASAESLERHSNENSTQHIVQKEIKMERGNGGRKKKNDSPPFPHNTHCYYIYTVFHMLPRMRNVTTEMAIGQCRNIGC